MLNLGSFENEMLNKGEGGVLICCAKASKTD